jgi:hypothetical protein
MSTEIKVGDRVRICVGTEVRDPWLSPKEGWEGIAVSPALNMEATHWQIKFAEPWCSLGMTRIMPISAMVVIGGKDIDVSPMDSADVPIEAPQVKAEIDGAEEAAPAQIEDSEDALGDLVEDDILDNELEPEAVFDIEIELAPTEKGSLFELNTLVRVKNKAGSTAGEEHIVQRRGMVGQIIRLCEIATSCVEVEFENQSLPVMIPRAYLQPLAASSRPEVAGETETPRKIKAAQMKLPF